MPCLILATASLTVPRVEGPDLQPTPDAMEYAMLARKLATGQPPLIELGGTGYPSRYPLTFPLLVVPFAWIFGGALHCYYWAAWFYSLLASGMLALASAKLLRSRWAGTLAAAFWALHPQTIWSSIHLMRENIYTLGFSLTVLLMLSMIKQPPRWLGVKASLLGLLTGFLAVGFPPWLLIGLLIAAALLRVRSICRNPWALASFATFALLPILLDRLYRLWAYGGMTHNGYEIWAPEIYNQFWIMFNPRYLTQIYSPVVAESGFGNLRYYAEAVLGRSDGFYGRPFGGLLIASCIFVFWRRWRNRISRTWMMAHALWGLSGAAFCLLYFFQSERFVQFWIYLADLAVAAGLLDFYRYLVGIQIQRPRSRWRNLIPAGLVVILAAGLMFGQIRRDARYVEFRQLPYDHPRRDDLLSLLELVPDGVPLYANYELAVLGIDRPNGPNGALYVHNVEFWQNGHALGIYLYDVQPHPTRSAARDWPPLILFDPKGEWIPKTGTVDRLFSEPVYILIADPKHFPFSHMHVEQQIIPALQQFTQLQLLKTSGDMGLYRASR